MSKFSLKTLTNAKMETANPYS